MGREEGKGVDGSCCVPPISVDGFCKGVVT